MSLDYSERTYLLPRGCEEATVRRWKYVFLLLEAIVLLPCLLLLFAQHLGWQEPASPPRVWQFIVAALYLLSWLFLLIGSPFFLRSLRGVALAGWIIAFGILLCTALTPRL